MHSLSPARAMARRARRLVVTGLIVVLVGLMILAVGILSVVIPLARADWYEWFQVGAIAVGLLVGLIGLIVVVRGLTFPSDNPYALTMAGELARVLDYRYTFIRNVSRRNLGYLDGILLGPNGALVFYFFDQEGVFYLDKNIWFKRVDNQFRPANTNPTREAVKDVNALREFFTEYDLGHIPVFAVVVMPSQKTVLTAQHPVVPVAHVPLVLNVLRDNYFAAERIEPAAIKAATQALLVG